VSTIATCLATHRVAPGASISVADAALVTEANLAALGDTLCITRFPATSNECGRLITEAVAHNTWDEVGVLAHTQPTRQRPVTSYKAYESHVTLYGTASRAVVVHSSAQDKRRQPRLERDTQASYSTVQAATRRAEQQEYCCRADAEAAAVQLRAVHTAYHHVEVTVEERPVYGRGRPSPQKPRPITAIRYRLKTATSPQTEHIARLEDEAGCFVLLTKVPTAGDLAHSARDLLTVYKDQHGTEQNYGFLKDPVIVNSLFLKKEERIEA
jgi:transposase